MDTVLPFLPYSQGMIGVPVCGLGRRAFGVYMYVLAIQTHLPKGSTPPCSAALSVPDVMKTFLLDCLPAPMVPKLFDVTIEL